MKHSLYLALVLATASGAFALLGSGTTALATAKARPSGAKKRAVKAPGAAATRGAGKARSGSTGRRTRGKKARPNRAIKAKSAPRYKFPPLTVPAIVYAPPRRFAISKFSFKMYLGKQAIVMVYFLPGHTASEVELRALSALQVAFAGKVKFVGITKAKTRKDILEAYKSISNLGVSIPVLLDRKGLLAYATLTTKAPSYSVITRAGLFRLTNATSLAEKVAPRRSLAQVIAQVATGRDIPFTRAPGETPNPYDLIDRPAPSFDLPHCKRPNRCVLSRLTGKKAVLLFFWSVSCPHCRSMMPLVQKTADRWKRKLNLVTVTIPRGKKWRKRLRKYLGKVGANPRVALDSGAVSNAYRVFALPCMFLLGRKGIVRSVYIGGSAKVISDLRRDLLHWAR